MGSNRKVFYWKCIVFKFESDRNDSSLELLQISNQVTTNLSFFGSAIRNKGFSSLAFAALLSRNTWDSHPEKLSIAARFDTTDFRSSENGFKVLSRVAFATKVFRRLLSPCSWWRKLEIHARKTFESGPDFKVFFSLDRKSVVNVKWKRINVKGKRKILRFRLMFSHLRFTTWFYLPTGRNHFSFPFENAHTIQKYI